MAVHLLGHFAGTFPGHTYMAERPFSLLFLICVLWILLVLCESDLASAIAERFLVFVHKPFSKLERPPGFMLPGCLEYIRSTPASLRPRVIGAKHRTAYLRAAKQQASAQRAE